MPSGIPGQGSRVRPVRPAPLLPAPVPVLTGRRSERSGPGAATHIPEQRRAEAARGAPRRGAAPAGPGGRRRRPGWLGWLGWRGAGRPAGLSARPARGQRRGHGAPASPGHQSPGRSPLLAAAQRSCWQSKGPLSAGCRPSSSPGDLKASSSSRS